MALYMIPHKPRKRNTRYEDIEPQESDPIYCLVCGEPCETFYFTMSGEIAGCENCIRAEDAWEYFDD